jgi:aminocarboxymuconate-semialdehyde decarboxylase
MPWTPRPATDEAIRVAKQAIDKRAIDKRAIDNRAQNEPPNDTWSRMSTEFVDIHAHFLPTPVVTAFDRPHLIELDDPGDPGGVTLNVLGKQMVLPSALADVAALLADMDVRGIVKRYVSIPPFLLLYELAEQDGIAWAREYNDSIVEFCRRLPDRLAPVATLPMGSPAAAVAELERVERLGVRMVQLATNVLGRELADPSFRRVFEALHRSGTMALLHPHYIEGRYGSNRFHLRNLIGNPFETAFSAVHLAASGLFEEFPGIRICLSHGGGALPFLSGRLRHGGEVREEFPLRDVDETLRSFWYDSAVFSFEAIDYLVAAVGAERIYYGTDFPFDMSDPLGPAARFAHLEPSVLARLPRDLPDGKSMAHPLACRSQAAGGGAMRPEEER